MIRELTNRDASQINNLYRQLYSNPSEVDFTAASFSTRYVPLAYELNGKLIGFIVCVVIKFGNMKEAYIEELVVDQNFRKQGVGTQLVKAALDTCKDSGVEFVFVATDPDEGEASPIPFYEKQGFKITKQPWLARALPH